MNLLNYMSRGRRKKENPVESVEAPGVPPSPPRAANGPKPQGPFRVWKMLLVAVLASVLGGAAVYGLHDYRQRIAWENANCVRPAEMRLARGPSWMTPEIAQEIRLSLSELPERLSVFDTAAPRQVAQCLERNPWIRRATVRFDQPRAGKSNGVEVALVFRRPVAFVEVGQGAAARYALVDREGVRLGGRSYAEPQLGDRVLLVVTGVASAAPQAGQLWNDPQVRAGAAVGGLFCDRVVKFNLSRIDVSNLGGKRNPRDAEIVLFTKQAQTRILWGGPPGDRRTEILEGWTAQQKLQYLDSHCQGILDGRVPYIDLVERVVGEPRYWRPAAPGRGAPLRS